jgi:hypothetical protein
VEQLIEQLLEYAEPTKELFERVYDDGARIIAEEHIAEEEEAFLKEEQDEQEALEESVEDEEQREEDDKDEDSEVGSEAQDNFSVNLGAGSPNQKLGKVALPPIKKDDRSSVISNASVGTSYSHRNSVASVSKMALRHLSSFRGGLPGMRGFNTSSITKDIAARRQSAYSANVDSNRRRRSSVQKLQLCYSVLPAGCQNVRSRFEVSVKLDS